LAAYQTAQHGTDVRKAGGVAFLLAGVLYFININLFIIFSPPSTGEGLLRLVNDQTSLVQSVFTIFLIINTSLIVALTALYLTARASGAYILFGYALGLVGLTVDLISTISAFSLINLGRAFAAATSDGQRAVYAVLAQQSAPPSVGDMFFTTLFSIAILVIGVGARKALGKSVGYLGVIAGTLGTIGGVLGIIPLSILWPVCFIVAGHKLYRLRTGDLDSSQDYEKP